MTRYAVKWDAEAKVWYGMREGETRWTSTDGRELFVEGPSKREVLEFVDTEARWERNRTNRTTRRVLVNKNGAKKTRDFPKFTTCVLPT